MSIKKDYMLRTRLTPLEKRRLEMLVLFIEQKTQIKMSKARIFAYLIDKEFEALQMELVNSVSKNRGAIDGY